VLEGLVEQRKTAGEVLVEMASEVLPVAASEAPGVGMMELHFVAMSEVLVVAAWEALRATRLGNFAAVGLESVPRRSRKDS
jgi:hypothetical protein